MVSIGSHVYVYRCKTAVRTVYGNSNGFEVKVSMQPRFSIEFFSICDCLGALSTEFRVTLPWELLYADDLVVIAETEDDLIEKLNEY